MSVRHKEKPIELEVNNVFANSAMTSPPEPLTSPPEALTPSPELLTSSPEPRCITTPGGFFGEFNGDYSKEVSYRYQVETVPQEELEPEIVSRVETAVLDSLLPELFEGECISDAKRSIRRRRLELIGASVQPPDRQIVGVDCEGELSEGNSCFVMDGKLTLFGDDPGELVGLVEPSRDVIRERMNGGAYNGVHWRVINVSFRNDLDTTSNGGALSTKGGDNGDSSNSSGVPTYGWVFVALVPAVICMGLLYWRHRRDKRKLQEEQMGGFPVAVSSEEVESYRDSHEDPVVGLTVSTPEATDKSASRMAPSSFSDDDLGSPNSNSPDRGIGIASRQSRSLNEDYLAGMQSISEPAEWEPHELT